MTLILWIALVASFLGLAAYMLIREGLKGFETAVEASDADDPR